MRVRLESIGCRLNIGEIESMARNLAGAGHRIVGPGEPAELCILNTCTVTSIASKKSRQLIRQLRRANPGASVVATGCDTEMQPERAAREGVDLVVSNADKDRLLEIVENRGLLAAVEPDIEDPGLFTPGQATRTRAFLKVQDGCDNRCTFCITTVARGTGRSLDAGRIIRETRTLIDLGYRELVLSGVHLGSYGHDRDDRRGLANLVERILAETAVPRLRLSSLEPWDLDRAFFDLFSDARLLPHLHLPLQSGCDTTLKRMARKTTREDFSQLVAWAREAVPGVGISTDLIVGFPGETDEEFEESISFVEEMAFSRLHIFRYSRREGTPAASMSGHLNGAISSERSNRMHQLGAQLEMRFNSDQVGTNREVLWETAEDRGDSLLWSGLTPNYVRVAASTAPDEDLFNTVTPTEITAAVPGGVEGRVLSQSARPMNTLSS